jgi:hypothetical protein
MYLCYLSVICCLLAFSFKESVFECECRPRMSNLLVRADRTEPRDQNLGSRILKIYRKELCLAVS